MNITKQVLTTLLAATTILTSASAQAQRSRQDTKNEWRNIATVAGVAGLIGLLKNDKTLFFAGTAGALYGAWRYEEDRKSQNKAHRARAAYFARPYFVRDGVRYNRKTVWKNGKKYYQFVRASKKK